MKDQEIPVMLSRQELLLLHKLADRAYRVTVEAGNEQLSFQDLAAKLDKEMEKPFDELSFKEALVALLPEHLQDVGRRLIVYNEGENVAAAIWCECDVFNRAKERGMTITREQAQEVVAKLDDKQDASLGITWDTIDCWLDELNLPEIEGEGE